MSAHEAKDPTDGTDAPMDQVAGELAAELARSAENALPPALARRLVELGESEVARRRLTPRALRAERTWVARAGWVVAAAAVAAWMVVPSPLARRPGSAGDASAADAAALAADASMLHAPWAASADPAARSATGEVVWDAATQRGVLRIRGVVPNDPRLAQYQLWIIDGDRDARYPVDGGVFDVSSDGEVLIPVRARLHVGRPTLFAVTLEVPGGVVVSSRERLVLAAPVPG